VLMDPCIHTSPRSLLSSTSPTNCSAEYGVPPVGSDPFVLSKMNQVNLGPNGSSWPSGTEVPRFQNLLGHTYSPACNRGLIRGFEQDQWRDKLFTKELQALDSWKVCYKPKPWDNPMQNYPSGDIPPGCPCSGESTWNGVNDTSSTFSGCGAAAASGGCGGGRGGKTVSILTKSLPICDYGERRIYGIQMANALKQPCGATNVIRINPNQYCRPLNRIQTIYHGCEGMVPLYGGHVPGEQFRYGKTYGTSTRNAKRAIQTELLGPLCSSGAKTNYGF